jgi:hypothetical protein
MTALKKRSSELLPGFITHRPVYQDLVVHQTVSSNILKKEEYCCDSATD